MVSNVISSFLDGVKNVRVHNTSGPDLVSRKIGVNQQMGTEIGIDTSISKREHHAGHDVVNKCKGVHLVVVGPPFEKPVPCFEFDF